MIDCLYNITAILQDPGRNGPRFRKYGYKKLLMGLDEDQARYGGKPEWDEWIAKGRDEIDWDLRNQRLTSAEVMAENCLLYTSISSDRNMPTNTATSARK